ncbi:MAG: sn-glycerol-1-phosphate dehydrogenase, partial [Clostridia bacterium]|nr:sn-glycerol-1-phosphate dehydrogenase [Clostridia bacterium]
MNINKLLQGFDCPCGKRHTCDIEAVYIEKGAVSHLKNLCAEADKILLAADENTFAAAGELVLNALSGKKTEKVIFSGKTLLIPDEKAVSAVESKLDSADMIVGVGSGVIQDLCKYVSHKNGVPYIIVATAPSMDGYASDGAAMIINGMKVTYSACLPRAIIADTQVLAAAPKELLQAGCGDIAGKFSALTDWKLSRIITGEYFCEEIYGMTLRQTQKIIPLIGKIVNERDESSIAELMNALVAIGILMSFAGSSRPASGSEHHLAHFFEITGIIEKKPYFSHGVNVAFSSYIISKVCDELAKSDFPQTNFAQTEAQLKEELSRVYGPSAQNCLELQRQNGSYDENRAGVYREKEKELRA